MVVRLMMREHKQYSTVKERTNTIRSGRTTRYVGRGRGSVRVVSKLLSEVASRVWRSTLRGLYIQVNNGRHTLFDIADSTFMTPTADPSPIYENSNRVERDNRGRRKMGQRWGKFHGTSQQEERQKLGNLPLSPQQT